MEVQGFDLPKLFTQKVDAVKFLHDNGLWLVHPGLAVTGMVEPKLKVRFGIFVLARGVNTSELANRVMV